MKRIKYFKGEKIGKLTFIEDDKKEFSVFRCYCGRTFTTRRSDVKNRKTLSCGCLKSEMLTHKNHRHGDAIRGNSNYLYTLWVGIKNRCYNYKYKEFYLYGGRGITMYKEWVNNYSLFKNDILSLLGEKPTSNYSLDRIDNDGDYVPENVRWETKKTQRHNQRIRKLSNEDVLEIKWLSVNKYTNKEIAKDYNVTPSLISKIKNGYKHKILTNKVN